MKIYFSIIEDSAVVKQDAEALLTQLALGNIEESEKLAQQLFSSADSSVGIFLSEDDWTSMLKVVRESDPDFAADIVLGYDSVKKLNQCIDSLPSSVCEIIRLAFSGKTGILEMPMEDEE